MHAIRVALLAGLLMGCGNTDKDLCEDFFEPYPDLITGRVVMETNRPYIRMPGFNKTAHLYLANAYLATGRPYDAELQLDHLGNDPRGLYRDEREWYTVLCWVCSGQRDRALAGAKKIAARKHTFQDEARRLVDRLQ
jgi:hypothetical protein